MTLATIEFFGFAVWNVAKVFIAASMVVYGGLVLVTYITEGAHYWPKLDLAAPVRSTERLLVWLGVKALAAGLRAASALFDMLTEASADVGEWLVLERGAKGQAKYRSRLL